MKRFWESNATLPCGHSPLLIIFCLVNSWCRDHQSLNVCEGTGCALQCTDTCRQTGSVGEGVVSAPGETHLWWEWWLFRFLSLWPSEKQRFYCHLYVYCLKINNRLSCNMCACVFTRMRVLKAELVEWNETFLTHPFSIFLASFILYELVSCSSVLFSCPVFAADWSSG